MGFGLTISKQIVEKLDGEINMKSEFNKGTIFSYTLPLEKVPINEIEEEK